MNHLSFPAMTERVRQSVKRESVRNRTFPPTCRLAGRGVATGSGRVYPPAMIEEHEYEGFAGRHLFYRNETPESPRATLVLIHGFGEHSGRYAEAIGRFANHGLATWASDLRGFGRSAKLIGHMEGLANVAEDLRMFTALARAAHPELPLILLGHSLGGLLALNQLVRHQDDYDLAITSGPALLPPENASGFVIAMAKVLARVAPRLALSPLEQGAETRNEEVRARDREDPLIYRGGFRARTGYELIQTQLFVRERLHTIQLPFLALHGGGDLIISPRATEILCDEISSEDRTKHVFPGLYHEIMNEPERDEVFRYMFDWIDARL